MDALGNLLIAPMQNWDSVICTSPAVKSHVLNILDAKQHYLKERFDIQKVPKINLPVIPLGIDTRRFEPLSKYKATARLSLRISDDEIVICFVGRFLGSERTNSNVSSCVRSGKENWKKNCSC